jgi:aminoglycoside 2'-N-acetyltransferase I
VTTLVLLTDDLPRGLHAGLRELLDEAFGGGDFSDDDWSHSLGGWHVVITDGARPVAHGSVVERELHVADVPFRTGYVEAVATSPARRREGLATSVMRELAALIERHFELGALSTGTPRVYARLGWEQWRGPTAARRGGVTVRTPEDDDALMVLRFGPSAHIDLHALISCPGRAGDDW